MARGWVVRGLTVLLVGAWPAIAFADDEPPEDPRKDHAFGIGIGIYSFEPFLRNATFHGEGVPKTGGPRQYFVHSGRELGASRPSLLAMELRLDYLSRHFEGGLHLFYAGRIGAPEHATDPAAAAIADGSTLDALGGGAHAAAVFPFAQSFTFSAGADVGVRAYGVDLVGYRKRTCHTKRGSHPCDERADTEEIYLQPRLALTWNAAGARKDNPMPFAVGLWAGPDFANGASFAFGFTLMLATPHSQLR